MSLLRKVFESRFLDTHYFGNVLILAIFFFVSQTYDLTRGDWHLKDPTGNRETHTQYAVLVFLFSRLRKQPTIDSSVGQILFCAKLIVVLRCAFHDYFFAGYFALLFILMARLFPPPRFMGKSRVRPVQTLKRAAHLSHSERKTVVAYVWADHSPLSIQLWPLVAGLSLKHDDVLFLSIQVAGSNTDETPPLFVRFEKGNECARAPRHSKMGRLLATPLTEKVVERLLNLA